MARHSYSHGSAADGGIVVVIALIALLRVVGLVFRVLTHHFFHLAILVPFLLCFVSAAAWVLSVAWQWVDYNWWYFNLYLWNAEYITGGAFVVSIVVFFVCCVIVDTYYDDTARPGGDDLTSVMSNKWKY